MRGLPLSTYAPTGGGWGQASYTFPLRITCKKGEGGPESMYNCVRTKWKAPDHLAVVPIQC